MAGNLDQHIRLRNVDGVVSHLGQEHSVDLQQEKQSWSVKRPPVFLKRNIRVSNKMENFA